MIIASHDQMRRILHLALKQVKAEELAAHGPEFKSAEHATLEEFAKRMQQGESLSTGQ